MILFMTYLLLVRRKKLFKTAPSSTLGSLALAVGQRLISQRTETAFDSFIRWSGS